MIRKCFMILLGISALTASAVTIEETAGRLCIVNPEYKIQFEKKEGYSGTFLSIGKSKTGYTRVEPIFFTDGEHDQYERRFASDPGQVFRKQCNMKYRILKKTPQLVQVEFTGKSPAGTIREILSFDDSPAIHYQVSMNHILRLYRHVFAAGMANAGADGIFLPDGKRVTGVWQSNGGLAAGANWRFAYYPGRKLGLGIVVPPQKNLSGIEYAMQGKKEGWGQESANLRAGFDYLSRGGRKGNVQFHYYLLATSKPELAKKVATALLPPERKLIRFKSYETEKLSVRPGQSNTILAEIENLSEKNGELILRTGICYGLDQQQKLSEQSVSIKPGEVKKVQIKLNFPPEARRGIAVVSELIGRSGAAMDRAREFCTVTDRVSRDAGFGIINVAQAYQDGSQSAWNRLFKRNYIGAYEYYCWADSVIFNLAPKEDHWKPNTEHSYAVTVTKKFLKELVRDAHSKGVGVYAWITGLWNYKFGLRYPDWLQYNSEGQPNIYSGSVYPDGRRRAVLKANMFYPERARIWAEEMCDSIDMFGWDGCRWDWTFIPSAMCDPLYMGEKAEDWYDSHGIPSSKLFPNPDQTGAECLKVWRETVKKRHPDFIFGTNYGSSLQDWKEYPRWHGEAARDALTLFEDMLGFQRENIGTFEKWGLELAIRTDKVREFGGFPVVGAMRGLPAGSVSHNLANYTCAAAGVKWWAYANASLVSGEVERNRFFLRFAEYYYDPAFRRNPEIKVELSSKERILFKPFVRSRCINGKREVIVPLVNLPEDGDWICQFHMEPPVRKNLIFRAENAVSAYWMSPQKPEKAQRIEVKNGVVCVPELVDSGLLLLQYGGK